MADDSVKFQFESEGEDQVAKNLDGLQGKLKGLAALVVGAFSVAAVIDFGKQCLQAANEAENVKAQLYNAAVNAKALGDGYDKNTDGLKKVTFALLDYSSELQKTSTYDDEAIAQAETKLLQAGLTVDSIKKLTPALLDQVAATNDVANADSAAVSMAEVLGKAVNGNTGILSRYNIILSDHEEAQLKTMDAQQRASFIADKLSASYGGAAEAMRLTTEGATKAMGEQWSNFQQTLGEALQPAVMKVLEFGTNLITGVQAFMADLQQKWDSNWMGIRTTVESIAKWFTTEFLPGFQSWVQDVQDTFAPMVEFFQEHWDEIKVIWDTSLSGLGLAWSVFWAAIKAAFSTAWAILKAAINLALDILKGDWGKAWTDIQILFETIWKNLQTFLNSVVDAIVKFLSDHWTTIYQDLDNFKTTATKLWNDFWDGFKAIVTQVVNWITEQMNKIISTIQGAIEWLKKLASAAGSGVSSGLNSIASVGNSIGNTLNLNNLGKKAAGGPVTGGTSYIVGEQGPEVFTPSMNGRIIPNGGAGGTTIVVNFNGIVSSKEVAEEYADLALRKLFLSTAVV